MRLKVAATIPQNLVRGRGAKRLASLPGCGFLGGPFSGGVAALNHRLQAFIPAGITVGGDKGAVCG